MVNYSKASERGYVGTHSRMDTAAASQQLRRRVERLPLGAYTQNTTTPYSRGPVGQRVKVIGAWLSHRTLPAGGALTVKLSVYDASANAQVDITETLDGEAGTVREGAAFTLAATNPTVLEADDTWEIVQAADNNAVGTAQVDGYISVLIEPVEDDILEDD